MERFHASRRANPFKPGACRSAEDCRGFTILEALIATVMLVAGLLAIMSFLNSAIQVAAEAQARTVATTLAESKLQALQSYLQITDSALSSAGNDCDEPLANEAVNATFTRCWWVDDSRAMLPITDPESSCIEGGYSDEEVCWISVRVDVTWTDRQAHLQQVSLASMLNLSAPERSALDLMALVTHAQQSASPPQWVVAADVIEEGEPGDPLEPGDGGMADIVPDMPDNDPSQPVTCSFWELEDEPFPNPGNEDEDEC